mgnify:CR=1 FL=1
MTAEETILLIVMVVVAIANARQLVRVRRLSLASGALKRHVLGREFIVLMLIASLVLDDLAGPCVRDIVASLFGVVGIVLVLSGFHEGR